MAKIINLKRARKLRQRREAEAESSQNRLTFGTSPKLRKRTKSENQSELARLEAHKRDPDGRR